MGRRTVKVRPATKSSLMLIDRIWAVDGMVFTQLKNGRVTSMGIRDAAIRAADLNRGAWPAQAAAHRDKLVEQIIAACKDAQRQRDNPDSKTALVGNVIKGLTMDGKQRAERPAAFVQLDDWALRFPLVKPDELEMMQRENAPLEEKLKMLSKLNEVRTDELFKATAKLSAASLATV